MKWLLHHHLVVVSIIILWEVRVLVLLNNHFLILLLCWGLTHRAIIPIVLQHVLIDLLEEIGVRCESHAILLLLIQLLMNHGRGLFDLFLYGRLDFYGRGRLRVVLSELLRLLRALLDSQILVMRP